MSAPGALAITGLVLGVTALAAGLAAGSARDWRTGDDRAALAWLLTALAAGCLIASAWWEALS